MTTVGATGAAAGAGPIRIMDGVATVGVIQAGALAGAGAAAGTTGAGAAAGAAAGAGAIRVMVMVDGIPITDMVAITVAEDMDTIQVDAVITIQARLHATMEVRPLEAGRT